MADRSFDESLQLQTLRISLDEREDEDRHVDDLLATLKLFRGLEELDLNGIYNAPLLRRKTSFHVTFVFKSSR